MASREELNNVASGIRDIERMVVQCSEVVQALLEVGKPLWTKSIISAPSDHERLQITLNASCQEAVSKIRALKRDDILPDLIRAEAAIESIHGCCASCKHLNQGRLQNGQPFRCLVQEEERQRSSSAVQLRFRIADEEGNISEQA